MPLNDRPGHEFTQPEADAYIALTKPDVSFLVLMTTAAAFTWLRARGLAAHAARGLRHHDDAAGTRR